MNSAASPSASRGLFAEVVRRQQAGGRGAFATPLWFSGSVPLRAGFHLLIPEEGSPRGTMGGGLLEGQVMAAAREVMAAGEPRVLEFDLAGDGRPGWMTCGGACAVLIEPVRAGYCEEVFAATARAEAEGTRAVLITLLPEGGPVRKLMLTPAGEFVGGGISEEVATALREAAQACLEAEAPQFLTEPVRAHLEPVVPRPTAYIFGGGHIGAVVAQLASLVGFRVAVVDDREEFANRERFPTAEEVLAVPAAEAFAQLAIGEEAYVVTVTRGHAHDEEVLVGALRTPARYIGMIGSRRKIAGVFERLRPQGFTDDDLGRVHAPIGLAIEAETVEEIAVSIIAELIAVRRGAVR